MIDRFGDYDKVQAYSDYATLPKGGYVCKIMNAEVQENSVGKYVKVSLDIAEGEYKDFYIKDWKGQQAEDRKWRCNYLLNIPKDDGSERDGWAKRKFKTFTEALEESNEGYHFDWDEQKFKGKLIGGIFNIREYEKRDGGIGSTTNLAQVTAVEKIRKGDYKSPKDQLIDKGNAANAPGMDAFMHIPEEIEEEVPF